MSKDYKLTLERPDGTKAGLSYRDAEDIKGAVKALLKLETKRINTEKGK